MINVANALSLSRIPLGVSFLFAESATARVVLIVTAALTDLLDGWVARRFKQGSRAGEVLDPVTDKFFVAAVLAGYLVRGEMRVWEFALLWARDLYNALGYVALRRMRAPLRFRARLSGKLVTVAQMITLLALSVMPRIATWVIVITALLGLYSMIDYSRVALSALRRARERG